MIKRANPLRVLLVDDETHMQIFVGQILTTLIDCTITTAHDGAEALAVCRASDPELTFLDISMPRMSGVEALPEIRALKPALPIVMLTSIADEVVVEECLAKGASYYIRKDPFTDHLRTELKILLEDFFPQEELTPRDQTRTNPT